MIVRSQVHCPREIFAWSTQITSNKTSPAVVPLHPRVTPLYQSRHALSHIHSHPSIPPPPVNFHQLTLARSLSTWLVTKMFNDDILLLAYFLHRNRRNDVFVFRNWVIILIIGFANGNHAFAKEARMLWGGVHCSLTIPSVLPTSIYQSRLYRFQHRTYN